MSTLKFCLDWFPLSLSLSLFLTHLYILFIYTQKSKGVKRGFLFLFLLPSSNNILYPKEDKVIGQLLYACRNCHYQEVSDNNIVYKMEFGKRSTEGGTGIRIPKDAVADATLPRTRSVKCANCNHSEAVFFQAAAKGEEGLALFFVCCNTNCGHRWRD